MKKNKIFILTLLILTSLSAATFARDAKKEGEKSEKTNQEVSSPETNPAQVKPLTPYQEALNLAEKGDFSEALKKLNEAIIQEPNNVDAYFHRGMILFQEDDIERALNDFHKAIELNPDFAPAYVGEATVVFSKGELDKAIGFLDKAIERDPKFGLAYHNRGVARYYQVKYPEALKDLNKAIELGFEVDRDVYEQVSALSDLDATIEKLTKEIEANPDEGVGYYNRGIAYYHKQEYRKALDDINMAKSKPLPFPIEDAMVQELKRLNGENLETAGKDAKK